MACFHSYDSRGISIQNAFQEHKVHGYVFWWFYMPPLSLPWFQVYFETNNTEVSPSAVKYYITSNIVYLVQYFLRVRHSSRERSYVANNVATWHFLENEITLKVLQLCKISKVESIKVHSMRARHYIGLTSPFLLCYTKRCWSKVCQRAVTAAALLINMADDHQTLDASRCQKELLMCVLFMALKQTGRKIQSIIGPFSPLSQSLSSWSKWEKSLAGFPLARIHGSGLHTAVGFLYRCCLGVRSCSINKSAYIRHAVPSQVRSPWRLRFLCRRPRCFCDRKEVRTWVHSCSSNCLYELAVNEWSHGWI